MADKPTRKELTYWQRYDSWISGVCPYCGGSCQETPSDKGRHFTCLNEDCQAQNNFTNEKIRDRK